MQIALIRPWEHISIVISLWRLMSSFTTLLDLVILINRICKSCNLLTYSKTLRIEPNVVRVSLKRCFELGKTETLQ